MLIRLLVAKVKLEALEHLAFRWSFLFHLAGTVSGLMVFLLVDRYQSVVFGNRLQEATARFGTSYFGYVTLGLAISSLSSSSLGGVLGHFHAEKRHKTLSLILSSPVSTWDWAVSAGAASLVHAFLQFFLIFGVAIGILGLKIPSFSWAAAFTVVLISVPALWALSVMCLSTALLIRRGDPLGFVIGISLELLGGVYIPASMLPRAAQQIGHIIPISSSVEAMQGIVYKGAGLLEVSTEVERLAVLTLVYLPLAFVVLRLADRRARRQGLYFLS